MEKASFRSYPDTNIAFQIKIGDRNRDIELVEWVNSTSDGIRDSEFVYFAGTDSAEAFMGLFCDRVFKMFVRTQADNPPVISVAMPKFEIDAFLTQMRNRKSKKMRPNTR
ncbi:hypothetical protein EUV02_15470 [Polymorphobacter arshaanensis]|uniref:Uncharacterized protein n=1 Tax=Glacieibacterium arshaanense TaxID=2511025 RepID=A0A4Y9EJA8_9SPHN|nr:hypothetical protein [Polymorphobacter arshaanensis]TFU00045.1 hypothetical protein EUV02_15470 [Polymorphobacter arshaanensis]